MKVSGDETFKGEAEGGEGEREGPLEELCPEGGETDRVSAPETGGVKLVHGGGTEEFKSRSLNEADPPPKVSGRQTVFEGETRSTEGLEPFENLRSRTVFTEVRDGVVVVEEELGLFDIRLELDDAE